MPKIRLYLSLLALVTLLGAIVRASWTETPEISKRVTPVTANRSFDVEEHVILVQTKIVVGAGAFLQEISSSLPAERRGSSAELIEQTLRVSINDTLKRLLANSEQLKNITARYQVREQALLIRYLGEIENSHSYFEIIRALPDRTNEEQQVDTILEETIFAPEAVARTFTPEERSMIEQQMGWFTKLAEAVASKGSSSTQPIEDLRAESQKAWKKFAGCLAAAGVLSMVAVVACLTFLIYFLKGKTRFLFEQSKIPANRLLEIFVLYLAAMACSPWLVGALFNRGLVPNPLVANCIVITSFLLLTLWPLAERNGFRATYSSLGLLPNLRWFGDIARAPIFYLAAWVPLLALLIAYAFVVQALGIDVSKGSHPVVPLLLNRDDPNTRLLITILAVVVAPIVEETMFRGAFYGWLRQYLPAAGAIVLSAFIFAIVHPQGPIGVVPLTAIGMVLAFIREWRHSLIMSMCVHACFNGGTLFLILYFFAS